jgi:hypothetical protein
LGGSWIPGAETAIKNGDRTLMNARIDGSESGMKPGQFCMNNGQPGAHLFCVSAKGKYNPKTRSASIRVADGEVQIPVINFLESEPQQCLRINHGPGRYHE